MTEPDAQRTNHFFAEVVTDRQPPATPPVPIRRRLIPAALTVQPRFDATKRHAGMLPLGCWALLILALPLFAAPAVAQRGRGDSGGSDWRQRMMERMDSNGDGKLDESEVPERAREYIARASRDAGGSGKFPVAISSLTSGGRGDSGRGDRDRGRGDRGRDDRGRGSREQTSNSDDEFAFELVPGFGDDVLGFGLDPRQLNGRMVNYQRSYSEKVLNQLEQTLSSYDKDKNGVLEYEEWKQVKWQSDPRVSDLNKDGLLTSAELAERYRLRFGETTQRKRTSDRDRQSTREESSRGRGGDDRGGRGGDRGGRGSDDRGGRGGDRGGRGGDDRGGRGGSGRGGFDPSSMIQRMDKDGDGYLDFDKMDDRVKGFAGRYLSRYGIEAKGKVKVDTIMKKISGGSSSSSSKKSGPTKEVKPPEQRASEITRGADNYGGKFTFRKTSEKLDGTPEWWNDRDRNSDGQISMAEYLPQRTPENVRKFQKLDANSDGILEPSEVESGD